MTACRCLSLAAALALTAAGCALAVPPPTPTPSPDTATPAAVPTPPAQDAAANLPPSTGQKLSADASVDQVLQALYQRGQNLKDFTAEVKLVTTDESLGESSGRTGTAVYQKKGDGDARIRVSFDKKREGNKIYDQRMEYLLDNGWLTERDYQRHNEIRRQVLRPGEKIDLLKLGEGPFPLPVGQSPESVKKLFEVTAVPHSPKDPADTVHIKLKPRPDTQFARKFDSIDVWVNTSTEMPQRIQTEDSNKSELKQTDLKLQAINSGLKDSDFALEQVDGNWNKREEPYSD